MAVLPDLPCPTTLSGPAARTVLLSALQLLMSPRCHMSCLLRSRSWVISAQISDVNPCCRVDTGATANDRKQALNSAVYSGPLTRVTIVFCKWLLLSSTNTLCTPGQHCVSRDLCSVLRLLSFLKHHHYWSQTFFSWPFFSDILFLFFTRRVIFLPQSAWNIFSLRVPTSCNNLLLVVFIEV